MFFPPSSPPSSSPYRTGCAAFRSLAGVVLLFLASASLRAAEPPELLTLFPLGGCRGAQVTVTVTTSAGATPLALFFSHPGITAQAVPEGKFTVSIAAEVPVGDYDAWLMTNTGLTNPRRFAVGAFPDVIAAEAPQRNDQIATAQSVLLPATIHGQIDPGTDRDCFRFALAEKQRLTVLTRSPSLEGSVLPTLTLYDPAGREVGHDSGNLAEAVLDYVAARAGEYVLEIEDRAFRKGPNNAYLMELTSQPHLVAAFPGTLIRGKPQAVTLYGYGLPDGVPARSGEPAGSDSEPFDRELLHKTVTIDAPQTGLADGGGWTLTSSGTLSSFTYREPGCAGAVRLGLVDREVTLEQAPPHATRDAAQAVSFPAEIAGRLSQRGEVDWYRFPARKDQILWIEAVGERHDAAMDLELVIHDANGKPLVPFTDTAHAKEYPPECPLETFDPSGTWKTPADGEYFLALRDLYGPVSGPFHPGYRLTLGPRLEEVAVIALSFKSDKPTGLTVIAGETSEWQLVAIRRGGHDREIRIRAENLLPGLEIKPVAIAENQFVTKLVLTAAADAPASIGKLTLIAETEVNGKPQTFPVRGATYVRDVKPLRARLTDGIAVAIAPKPAQ